MEMTGLDVIGEGTGDYPPPLDGAYLLVLDKWGNLFTYKDHGVGWWQDMEAWGEPQPSPKRWWLMRAPSTP